MFSIKAECFSRSLCELAEGPIWNEQKHTLNWVDIKRNCVLEQADPAQMPEIIFDMGQNIGCMALTKADGMILGMASGLYLYGPDGAYEKLEVEDLSPRVRFNDGKCDPLGRFWAGTINLFPGEEGISALYCVLPDRRIKKMLDGVTNSNGLAFTADLRTLYYIDTPTRRVDAFDIAEGEDGFPVLSGRRTVISFPDGFGWPDGMTIDTNDHLWIALWDSCRVYCFDPVSGEVLGYVETPVRAVSSCCFGGKDMDEIFITTAREGLSEAEEPFAGNVYYAKTGVQGVVSYRFGE